VTVVWTHQGDGIENTLAAFTNAWSKGVTHFETDIQVTSDGVLVLSHDNPIYRLTKVNQLISSCTFTELQDFKIFGQSSWARLDELISTFPTAKVSIDMKTEATLNPLVAYLSTLSDTSNLVVGSFNPGRVKRFRNQLPNIATALTIDEAVKIKLGVSIAKSTTSRYAMVPHTVANIDLVNSNFISKSLNNGIPCHVWTVNSKDAMRKLIDLGVTGIITDDIDLALACVQN
jgi:glycerophosphoryl diester phosphodiesterase